LDDASKREDGRWERRKDGREERRSRMVEAGVL
jgi:hypothetical protein